MIGMVHQATSTHIENSAELSPLLREDKITLSPITLYVDDSPIMASGPTLDMTAQTITMAFEETHKWLAKIGLKTDQVNNALMHFTKMKNWNPSPPIPIPTNIPGTLKEGPPAKCTRYLSLWFDPQLKFQEHAKITASKASRATKALHMLGNSTSRMNQLCLRQIYLGAILPIATYSSAAFWDGKSSAIKTILECAQNKAL